MKRYIIPITAALVLLAIASGCTKQGGGTSSTASGGVASIASGITEGVSSMVSTAEEDISSMGSAIMDESAPSGTQSDTASK